MNLIKRTIIPVCCLYFLLCPSTVFGMIGYVSLHEPSYKKIVLPENVVYSHRECDRPLLCKAKACVGLHTLQLQPEAQKQARQGQHQEQLISRTTQEWEDKKRDWKREQREKKREREWEDKKQDWKREQREERRELKRRQ